MNLKPFTEFDWCGFAGAEGDNPLIHYGNRATTIVDASCIQIIGCSEADDEPGMLIGTWHLNCTQLLAETIAEKLDDSQLTPEFLTQYGFRRID